MNKREKTQCHAICGMKSCAADNVYMQTRDKQIKRLPIHWHCLYNNSNLV